MIRLKNLLPEAIMEGPAPTHGSPPIDGKAKPSASNWIHGKVDRLLKGFFSDNDWKPIIALWKEFDKLGLNWHSTGSKYQDEYVRFSDGQKHYIPTGKVWTFEIKYVNNRQKPATLYGRIVASGAGPV